MANNIIDGDFLTVILNGGNGGDGQDGTASDDVIVTFGEPEHKGDRGYETISSIDNSTSLYTLLARNGEATFNITLHPRQCCGITGVGGAGGAGKTKNAKKFESEVSRG